MLDRDSADHRAAARAFRELRGTPLVTHNYVLVETSALVQRRLGPSAVRALVQDLVQPFEVVWVSDELHRVAVAAMLAGVRSSVSLVDWVSFEVMRRRRIDAAFALDRDFVTQGFQTIP